MCIDPQTVYVGPKGDMVPLETACHKCWQCRENAINDWVGRNIAENKTSVASFSITLTYGRDENGEKDHLRAAILTYRDVQLYLMLLRRHLGKVRYLITGEYGSTKGRAHWHGIIHFQDVNPAKRSELTTKWFEGGEAWRNHPVTKIEERKTWGAGELPLGWRFNDVNHWPHGYSFWEEAAHQAVRYVCKYIQKDQGIAERQGHLAMSKKPPLGSSYFATLAERCVAQGLSPKTLFYSFPEVLGPIKDDGTQAVIQFMMRGRTAELFLEHYIRNWRAVHGVDNWPRSSLVDLFNEYGRVVSDESRIPPPDDGLRKWAAATRYAMRDGLAAELSALIDAPVQGRHLVGSNGGFEYHRNRQTLPDGSVILEARWRNDGAGWRRMHWKKGRGWK